MANNTLLPTLITYLDNIHCSMNCQLINLRCCIARGYDPDRREPLKRDGAHYLRTNYCREESFEEDPETGLKKNCETCCYYQEDRLVQLCDTCENFSNWRN